MAEDKESFILAVAEEVLSDMDRSLLVFVYRKTDAVRLAHKLGAELDRMDLVRHFHSGLSREARSALMAAFREQVIRILVTTTSLKMGVNFPATDVIVRDTYFHGTGRLPLRDILQMTGRAGRGNTMGRAWILCERTDYAEFYGEGLATGRIEGLEPQLISATGRDRGWRNKENYSQINPVRALILSELAAHKDITTHDATSYLGKTYSASCGRFYPDDLFEHFRFLEDGKLIYKVEGSEDRYAATKLGKTVCLCGISPESGAMLAGFLRSLIRLNEKKLDTGQDSPRYLSRLTDLDFLFLASTSFEVRNSWLGAPSQKAITQVQEYLESLPPEEKPLVNLWRSENSKDYPTRRLLSTLKIPAHEVGKKNPEIVFYQVMRTAILLHQHSRGKKLEELASDYGIDEGYLENNLKFTISWVLSCLAQICDSRKCYKLDPLKMRILELIEELRFGANLGKLMTLKDIGRATIEKLLQAGYKNTEKVRPQIRLN